MYNQENDINFDDFLPDENEQLIAKTSIKQTQQTQSQYYDDSINPWLWNGAPIESIPKNHKSFVYLFTNKITGRQYIGFKTAVSKTTRVVKGKKKRSEKESDWKEYYSSSQEVLHDIAKYGRGNFIREIIALTVNKSVGKYFEAYYQFKRNVLLDKSNRYYNGIVNLRLNHRILKDWEKVEFATTILGDQLYDQLNQDKSDNESDQSVDQQTIAAAEWTFD